MKNPGSVCVSAVINSSTKDAKRVKVYGSKPRRYNLSCNAFCDVKFAIIKCRLRFVVKSIVGKL